MARARSRKRRTIKSRMVVRATTKRAARSMAMRATQSVEVWQEGVAKSVVEVVQLVVRAKSPPVARAPMVPRTA
jgi:hypothetical protein